MNLPARFPGSWNLRLCLAGLGCLAAACGGGDLVLPEDGAGGPSGIRVVNGDGQNGQVNELLTTPVQVAVTDTLGQPVEGATVEFELTSAGDGAEMLPPSALTNAAGNAEARIHLGSKVGVQSGEARVVVDGATIPKASFTATATANLPDNHPPRADYNWHCEGLSCQFTDASTDSDGNFAAWHWDFGDDLTSDQREPAHVFPAPGNYQVTLRVTDAGGLSDETSAHVGVDGPPAPANRAPHAEFEVQCSGLTCVFLDRSRDDDGTISSWVWTFGDGTSSPQQNPTHTYAARGKYDVLLTVTDNMGAADAKTRRVDSKD